MNSDETTEEWINDGAVPAKSTRQLPGIVFLGNNYVVRIEAKNTAGKIVFSHDYKMADLEKLGWNIVISPQSNSDVIWKSRPLQCNGVGFRI